MAGKIIWILCGCGCALLFDGIGIFAMRREKPMWFWSGSEDDLKAEQLSDVKAYNRANGIMWIVYSLLFWVAGLLGIWRPVDGAILLGVACVFGSLGLAYAYTRILKKYLK